MKFWTLPNSDHLPVGVCYCIGRNYADHAKEMNASISHEKPVVFLKPPSAVIQNPTKIPIPNFSKVMHHEIELVVVLGELSTPQFFGVGIDLTLRDLQSEAKTKGEPWAVSKGFKRSAPVSNLVAFDQFPHTGVELVLTVNSNIKQSASTISMERQVDELLEYLNDVFELQPGDCVFTGTPAGVGPLFSGDQLTAEIPNYCHLSFSIE